MFYIISIKDKDLKSITITDDKKIANKYLNRQEEDRQEGIERIVFTNKKDYSKAIYINCNNFSCQDIFVNLNLGRYRG